MGQSHRALLTLPDAGATEDLGAALAEGIIGSDSSSAWLVGLAGELGAGKTTLVRGLLRELGYTGYVRSPTYTLVESYELGAWRVFHLDLYRLGHAEELDYLGLRDFLTDHVLCVIEWPERAAEALPALDLVIRLEYREAGREAGFSPGSGRGAGLAARLEGDR